MELLRSIESGTVYLDTNIWIYALENYPQYSQTLQILFQALDQGHITACTSELTLAETLVKPIQRENIAQQTICEQFINSTAYLSVIPINRSILVSAAQIRANSQLKLPDAIHAATALQTHCTRFLTNDRQFQKLATLSVLLLSEMA